MYEVRAIASFDHHGSRKVGERFKVGSERHAEDLARKGLVKVLGAETLDAGGSATGGGVTAPTGGASDGAQLVRQKAADAIAAIAVVTDLALLDAALKAETAKGEKARATVVEAIETAIKAATSAQA